jgi:hypothetical protein
MSLSEEKHDTPLSKWGGFMATLLSLDDWKEALRSDLTALSLYTKLSRFNHELKDVETYRMLKVILQVLSSLDTFSQEDLNRLNSPLLDEYIKVYSHLKKTHPSVHQEDLFDETARLGCWKVFFDLKHPSTRMNTFQICEAIAQDNFEAFKKGVRTVDGRILETIAKFDRLEYQQYLEQSVKETSDGSSPSDLFGFAVSFGSMRIVRYLLERSPAVVSEAETPGTVEMYKLIRSTREVYLDDPEKLERITFYEDRSVYHHASANGKTELLDYLITESNHPLDLDDLQLRHGVEDFWPVDTFRTIFQILRLKKFTILDTHLDNGFSEDYPTVREGQRIPFRLEYLKGLLTELKESADECGNIELLMEIENQLKDL